MADAASSQAGFGVETIHLDLPALAGALARRLDQAGVPMTPARSADLARALTLVRPLTRRRLYWTARAVLVSDPGQIAAFDAVFFSVFGGRRQDEVLDPDEARPWPPPVADRPADPPTGRDVAAERGLAEAARGPWRRRRSPGGATRTRARRSTCRWRWRATRSGSPARASTGSTRTSSPSSTG